MEIVTGRWVDVAVGACGIVLLASFIHWEMNQGHLLIINMEKGVSEVYKERKMNEIVTQE